MYYHLANMVSLCSGRRGEIHAKREGVASYDDAGLSGHDFGHMKVPSEDYNVPLDHAVSHVSEGIYSAAGHKADPKLALKKLTETLPSCVRPAGTLSGPRQAAAMHLLVQDAPHEFKNCPQAWACCMMSRAGLVFSDLRLPGGQYFVSLGARSGRIPEVPENSACLRVRRTSPSGCEFDPCMGPRWGPEEHGTVF